MWKGQGTQTLGPLHACGCMPSVPAVRVHETEAERKPPPASSGQAGPGRICSVTVPNTPLTRQQGTKVGPAARRPDSASSLEILAQPGEKQEFEHTQVKALCLPPPLRLHWGSPCLTGLSTPVSMPEGPSDICPCAERLQSQRWQGLAQGLAAELGPGPGPNSAHSEPHLLSEPGSHGHL